MMTKRNFVSPHVKVARTELEGLICHSVIFNIAAKDLENMNDPETENFDSSESFYFES